MMRHLFVWEPCLALAERWLRDCAADTEVTLVIEPSAQGVAEHLKTQYAVIKGITKLPDPVPVGPRPSGEVDRIVVPLSFGSNLMKVKQGVHLPDVKPHYRLFHRLQRSGYRRFVITNLDGEVEWQIPHLLDDFAGLHAGRRCFVVGNGPSLGQLDMNLLRDEIMLGSNRVYLGFERWGFDFTYWGITDWFQIEEYASEYESRVPPAIPQFYPFEYLPYLRFPNGCPLNIYDHYRVPFSDCCRGLALGHSVSFALIQIAVVMGCNPIVLIGMDHRYNLAPRPVWQRAARSVRNMLARRFRGSPAAKGLRAWRESRQEARGEYEANLALWDTSHSRESTHFDERYAAGNRFLLPEPADAEREYRHALDWARKHGVEIVNATPDSALEVFPKVSFDGLFPR